MYNNENRVDIIRRQYNSSNVQVYGPNQIKKYIFPKIYQSSGDKTVTSSMSRLPLRSRSLTDRGCSLRNNSLKSKVGTISTWSDLSIDLGKIRSTSVSLSKLKSTSIKAEVMSRDPYNKPTICYPNGSQCIFKFPKHRNNSSCLATTKVMNQNRMRTMFTPNNNDIVRKEKGNELRNSLTKNNHSIFKFFKMKVNSFRDKVVEEKDIVKVDVCDKKLSEIKGNRSLAPNILDNPKTKDFLLKLYNECKKLNGNITKLYSDTNPRQGRLKQVFEKSRGLGSKNGNIHRRSRSSININVHSTSKETHDSLRDQKRSESELISKKGNEGHYYHLACIVSPDIMSTNNTRDVSRKPFLPAKTRENGKLSEEITNISSVKSNMFSSSSTSSITNHGINNFNKKNNLAHNKYPFINEFDDTLCDLDEDMNTDSSEISNVDPNELKSPISHSNYVTANDQNNVNGFRKNNDEINKESLRISSSLELPPIPSSKELEHSNNSPKIYPPYDFNELINETENGELFAENQAAINKFITVFEKQFPQRFVLRQASTNNDIYIDDNVVDPLSKFTSTITVNCLKNLNKPTNNPQSFKFFNPFKPPKSHVLKGNVSFNVNNNNSVEDDEESENDKKYSSPINDFPNEMEIKDKNRKNFLNDDTNNDEPPKRVAPLKQLLQHSRTSEDMNDVISNQRQDYPTSPTSNSCIEKQRLKKQARQQEQHQKAKDMAIEAARLRKERQSEIQAFDSFDSSRIIEKLFTTENDDNYPDFSLFDAVHYNFRNKKPRKLRPLVPSTITGILPEGPPEEPEPPKSPITTEKFRNQPFKVEKIIKHKKEISQEVLAKYESINVITAVQKPATSGNNVTTTKELHPTTTNVNITIENNSTKIKNQKIYSSSSSSSSSSDISSESLSSLSESTLSSTSQSSSSSLTPPPKVKPKLKKVKKHDLVKGLLLEEKKFVNEELSKAKTHLENDGEMKVKDNSIDIKESRIIVKESSDMNVGTEGSETEKCFEKITVTNPCSLPNLTINDVHRVSGSENVDCHLNYQTKYKDNVLDRTLPLNLCLPTPNTSLSSFANELTTQLHSLDDTIDILLNRMDILEVNILDCSRYFVHR